MLSNQCLQWIKETVHPQAQVTKVTPLKGGITSRMVLLHLDIEGEEREVVLRQVTNQEWLNEVPDLMRHEAASLQWVQSCAIPTPKLIGFDETGEKCGTPSLIMSRLPGDVILKPMEMEQWLEGLAKALVHVHRINPTGFQWAYYTYQNLETFDIPTWSRYPDKWKKLIQIAKGPRPTYQETFIHRDYHPNNVLWSGNQVSGIVDWVNSCRGPAGIDIGHCRVNLAQLYGVEVADAFLSAYQQNAESTFQYDPYWDMIALIDILFGPPEVYPGWTDLGVTGLTNKLMEARVDAYMLSLVEKI